MYLSNKAFTLTLHAEPDAVAKITTVSWQLDYSDLVYRMPADFDPESGIMTLDAELANHGQSGFQTVSYVWLTDDSGVDGRPIPVPFQLPPDHTAGNKGGPDRPQTDRPQTDKTIYIRTLAAHEGTVNTVAFSQIPGSNILATGGNDNMVGVWDLDVGREITKGAGHSQGVSSVAITPDEAYVISAGHDHTLRQWDLNTGELAYTWGDFLDSVTSVSISSNGRWIAAGSWDGSIHLNSLIDDTEFTLPIGDRVNSLAFSPDGNRLAVGLGRLLHDGLVAVLALNAANPAESTMAQTATLEGEASAVRFSNDGAQVAAGHGGGNIQIWAAHSNEKNLQSLKSMLSKINDRTVGVAFTPGTNPTLLTVSRNGYVHRWNAAKGELIKAFKLNTGLSSVAFSTDGNLLAMGTSDGNVVVLETGQIE